MNQPFQLSKKSTIVRFSLLASAMIASACSTLPQRLDASAGDCPPMTTKICEDFGPESRCSCGDARGLTRELGQLGFAARPSGVYW